MQLSEHFSLEEMTVSQTATRYGLDNTPTDEAETNLRNLCVLVLEPLREILGVPLRINSGYRSPKVNAKVGGAKTSQHCKGEAADILPIGMSVETAFEKIKNSNLTFDQLIEEGSWIHISYTTKRQNRRQTLKANFTGKKQVTYVEV